MKREITYEDYAKKLTDEYKDAYDKIFVYIKSALSIGDEISPAMNEVVDLLLALEIPIMHAMNSGTRKRKELYRIMKEKNVDFMSDELYRKVE